MAASQSTPTKKKGRGKWVLLGLLVLLIVVIAVSCSGGGGSSKGTVSDPSSSVASSPGSSSSSAAPAAKFPGQKAGDTVAQAGQTVTLDKVATTATPLTLSHSDLGDALCTTITIKNQSDKSVSFNLFNYKLQDPSGASRDVTIGGTDNPLNSGDLASGGTVSGDVCFKPTGQTGQHVLIYAPAFSLSSERAVWVNNL